MQGKSILVHTWFLTGSSTPDFGAGAVRLILHFVYARVLDHRMMLLIVNLRKNTLLLNQGHIQGTQSGRTIIVSYYYDTNNLVVA